MACYGILLTRLRDVIDTPRVRAWMERVSGLVLVGFAARLAVEKA
jgi:threonine/homoserine/homoserine lactone efflux protein